MEIFTESFPNVGESNKASYYKLLYYLRKDHKWENWINEILFSDDEKHIHKCLAKILDVLGYESDDLFKKSSQDLFKILFYDELYSAAFVNLCKDYYLYLAFLSIGYTEELSKYNDHLKASITNPVFVFFYHIPENGTMIQPINPFSLIIEKRSINLTPFMLELFTDALTYHFKIRELKTVVEIDLLNSYFTFNSQNPLEVLVKYNLKHYIDYFLRIKAGLQIIDNTRLLTHTKVKSPIFHTEVYVIHHLLALNMNTTNRKILEFASKEMTTNEYIGSIIIYGLTAFYKKSEDILGWGISFMGLNKNRNVKRITKS